MSTGGPSWDAPGRTGALEDPNAKVYDDGNPSMLPELHLYAYRGDLNGVLQCITDGHSVHDTVTMRNQAGRLVCGITPLFLAAQRGKYKLCKLLVSNGANPAQPAYIQDSADLCTPTQVARLNLHFKVSYYLNKAVEARKAEDKVLREEEEHNHAQQQRASAPPDASRGAPHAAMANLGDLSGWDPGTGSQPPLQTGNLLARMLKRNKVDLMAWRPDVERTKDGNEQMVASANRAVDPSELEGLEVANHTSVLNDYLQDADLAQWNPEGEDTQSMRGGAATSVAATGRRSLDLDNTGTGGGARGGAGNDSVTSSRATSPTPHQQQQQQQQQQAHARNLAASAHVAQQQHARASAAAAAAAAMYRPSQGTSMGSGVGGPQRSFQPQAPKPAPQPRAPATRWYAHGGSDSDDDEEDLEASASMPAAPPVSLRA